MTSTPGRMRSSQSRIALGFPSPHQKHDRRGVRTTVIGQTLLPVGREQCGFFGQRIDVVGQGQRHDRSRLPLGSPTALVPRSRPCDISIITLRPVFPSQCAVKALFISLLKPAALGRRRHSGNDRPASPAEPQPMVNGMVNRGAMASMTASAWQPGIAERRHMAAADLSDAVIGRVNAAVARGDEDLIAHVQTPAVEKRSWAISTCTGCPFSTGQRDLHRRPRQLDAINPCAQRGAARWAGY